MSTDDLRAQLAAHQRTLAPGGPCLCGEWPKPEVFEDWIDHLATALATTDPAPDEALAYCCEHDGDAHDGAGTDLKPPPTVAPSDLPVATGDAGQVCGCGYPDEPACDVHGYADDTCKCGEVESEHHRADPPHSFVPQGYDPAPVHADDTDAGDEGVRLDPVRVHVSGRRSGKTFAITKAEETLAMVAREHDGHFCICGAMVTDSEAHLATEQVAALLASDGLVERVAEAIRDDWWDDDLHHEPVKPAIANRDRRSARAAIAAIFGATP